MSPREVSPRDFRQRQRHYRTVGYDDGYAGKPAASPVAEYQSGWRRGVEARIREAAQAAESTPDAIAAAHAEFERIAAASFERHTGESFDDAVARAFEQYPDTPDAGGPST